ncbi:uncharacterized protein [Montipora foliosa]|uniref:uncharacterized protein n=1 Tax=Montipora foliosa TaxID=591990 RepID=UPI0035F16D96
MELFRLRSLFFFLWAVSQVYGAVDLPPVVCSKPIATTVPVDALQHRYFPYFVTLHRCQGSVKALNPQNVECVATVQRELKITVRSTKTWTETELRVMNHTTCGPACKTKPTECLQKVQIWNPDTCACECLYGVRSPPEHIIPRKNGFRWNPNSCRYECSRIDACPAQKEWDPDKCSCVCSRFYKRKCYLQGKDMDDSSCNCKDRAQIPTADDSKGKGPFAHGPAVALLVTALLVILLLVGLLCYQCKASNRACMKSAGSQSSQMTNSDETIVGPQSQCRGTVIHCITTV